MNEKRFVVGDRIRVTIDGTLHSITPSGTLTIQHPSDLGACETHVELEGTNAAVKLEHLPPANWPPRAGDLWRDNDGGDPWFAVTDGRGNVAGLVFVQPSFDGKASDPDRVNREHGPLTLVHREDPS